jgi:hypothetical protein
MNESSKAAPIVMKEMTRDYSSAILAAVLAWLA